MCEHVMVQCCVWTGHSARSPAVCLLSSVSQPSVLSAGAQWERKWSREPDVCEQESPQPGADGPGCEGPGLEDHLAPPGVLPQVCARAVIWKVTHLTINFSSSVSSIFFQYFRINIAFSWSLTLFSCLVTNTQRWNSYWCWTWTFTFKFAYIFNKKVYINIYKCIFSLPPLSWFLSLLRLVFFRTNHYATAHVFSSCSSVPVVTCSTKEWALKRELPSTRCVAACQAVGEVLAQRCHQAGITRMVYTAIPWEHRSDAVSTDKQELLLDRLCSCFSASCWSFSDFSFLLLQVQAFRKAMKDGGVILSEPRRKYTKTWTEGVIHYCLLCYYNCSDIKKASSRVNYNIEIITMSLILLLCHLWIKCFWW